MIQVLASGPHPIVRTQGDANPAPDGWQARLDTGPVWKARAVVPGLGQGIHLLRAPTLRRLSVWVAPVGFVLVALIEIWHPGPRRRQVGDIAAV